MAAVYYAYMTPCAVFADSQTDMLANWQQPSLMLDLSAPTRHHTCTLRRPGAPISPVGPALASAPLAHGTFQACYALDVVRLGEHIHRLHRP